MAEGFEITLPEHGPLRIRRSSTATRTHYVCPEEGGTDVMVVKGSRSVLDRVLEVWNDTARETAVPCRTTPSGPATHDLKILPEFFLAVLDGTKTFEVRRHDREFRVGDQLILSEWREESGYTGRWLSRHITYVLAGREAHLYGVARGYTVLGLRDPVVSLARACLPVANSWVICRPRRGGGWLPYISTARATRRDAIQAYEANGSSYKADRRRRGVKAMRCTLAPIPPANTSVRGATSSRPHKEKA